MLSKDFGGRDFNITHPTFTTGHLAAARVDTPRLTLNALTFSDVTALTQIFASAETARMTHNIPHPFEMDDAFAFLSVAMTEHSSRFPKWGIRFGDRLIGVITFSEPAVTDVHSFGPHMSLFIAHAYQNHGYGTEAVLSSLDWLRKHKNTKVVHAAHFADNRASVQVLTRTGFLYTGRRTVETSLMREGQYSALHMIRML